MTPELLLIKSNFALEAQYYYMNVARKDGFRNYTAQGAYGMIRTLLIGSQYTYSHADAGVATPAKGSLEFVLGYNYTNASDSKAGIKGGYHERHQLHVQLLHQLMDARPSALFLQHGPQQRR